MIWRLLRDFSPESAAMSSPQKRLQGFFFFRRSPSAPSGPWELLGWFAPGCWPEPLNWDFNMLRASPATSGTNLGSEVVPWTRKGICVPLPPAPFAPPSLPSRPPNVQAVPHVLDALAAELASVARILKSRWFFASM